MDVLTLARSSLRRSLMLFAVASAASILLDLILMILNPGGQSFPATRALLGHMHYLVPLLIATVAVLDIVLVRFLGVRVEKDGEILCDQPRRIFLINFLLFGILPALGFVVLRILMTDRSLTDPDFIGTTAFTALIYLTIGFILALNQRSKHI